MLKHRRAHLWFLRVTLLVALFAQLVSARPPDKKPLEVEDLFRFETAQSVTHAPDVGENSRRWAVYARQWIDGERSQRSSLWRIDAGASRGRALERGEPDARMPVISPDGKWIAFLSTRDLPQSYTPIPWLPAPSFPACDIWITPADGGAARPLAPRGKLYGCVFNDDFYAGLAFSRDSRRLAFIAEGPTVDRDNADRDNGDRDSSAREDRAAEPGGEGYAGYRNAQLWVADLDLTQASHAAKHVYAVTDDEFWYGDPQWLPSGETLVVHVAKSRPHEAVRWNIRANFDLWAIDANGARLQQLTQGPGPDIFPRVSPDGNHVAYLSSPRRGPHIDAFNLAVVKLAPKPVERTLIDQHAGSGQGKRPAPLHPLPIRCWKSSNELAYGGATGPRTTRELIKIDGPADAPRASAADEARQQIDERLSPLALNSFFEDRAIPENTIISWRNKDQALDGVLTLPPPGIGSRPYKLLVLPHGGPHSRSTTDFRFETALFADQGYAVFQPNYRGTPGYGLKFHDGNRFDFGGVDAGDILSGIDHLVAQGTVDRDRQFIYGASYGGFLTCWFVGQTNQFRAAVAQNPVTDLNMMWSLSDIPAWVEWEFGGRPWEVADALRKRSPLTHAHQVKTPTLVLLGDSDLRCPPAMGRAFHRVLESRGVSTGLVTYESEGHAIAQPDHRADILRRVLEWFERHDRR